MIEAVVDHLPWGRAFALSIVDDTDGATVDRVRAAYEKATQNGVLLTKTVWPLRASASSGWLRNDYSRCETLEDPHYVDFCVELQSQGHEVAMHTASAGSNTRARTLEAYQRFERHLGHPPYTNVMHGRNLENIYWGADIFEHWLAREAVRLVERQRFCGHVAGSPYYWGDICRERTRYVRLLETRRLNTLAYDPATPFHDPAKPEVRWWFSSTFAPGDRLPKLLAEPSLAKLRAARGTTILHTYLAHFAPTSAAGASRLAALECVFQRLSACRDGWYVPVVVLLDRIRAVRALSISRRGRVLTISNPTDVELPRLALRPDSRIRDGSFPGPLQGCQILLGDLPPQSRLDITVAMTAPRVVAPRTREPDYPSLALETALKMGAQRLARWSRVLRR